VNASWNAAGVCVSEIVPRIVPQPASTRDKHCHLRGDTEKGHFYAGGGFKVVIGR